MERVFLNLCGRSREYPEWLQPNDDDEEKEKTNQKITAIIALFLAAGFLAYGISFGYGYLVCGTAFQMGLATGFCILGATLCFYGGLMNILLGCGIVTKREVDQVEEKTS